MATDLFDMDLRAARRGRAFRRGPQLFLYERAFEDCLDRLGIMQRRFRSALLIGCPDPSWLERLRTYADNIEVRDPGLRVADAADGVLPIEDQLDIMPGNHDLCLAIGTLDTVNDLPRALVGIRLGLTDDAVFLGALSGGDTLPQLRAAMRAADALTGVAVPHIHPRIEPPALAALLGGAGFINAVIDIDRAQVSYRQLPDLVADLRAMGATNLLKARPRRSMSKAARRAAIAAFAAAGDGERTTEIFEILYFAAWTPASGMPRR